MPGRDIGFDVGVSADPDQDYDVDYHYDDQGRFEQITGPGLPAYGAVYTRLDSSELIEYLRFSADATTLASVHREYESDRDLVEYVENKAGTDPVTTISKYTYVNDDLGRRTSVVYTGSAFGSGHHNDYDYNHRSELTAADRKDSTTPGTGTHMDPGDFDYDYDNIGNRDSHTLDEDETTYTSNDLNQYTDTTNPPESFTYDDDGNLTADGTHSYTWDAENRLICVEPTSPGEDDVKLVFDYDYMSRRVRKRVYAWDDVAEEWEADPETDLKFVYDYCNVVLLLHDSNGVLRKYTWGLDLSGESADRFWPGMYGAGGIGGLLACVETQLTASIADDEHYSYLYDGNGNVGQVLDITDTGDISVAAKYEYDPYGNNVCATGDYAGANPFRYSTMWLDDEIESPLCYMLTRYYSPRLGRFLSRDAIEEAGGNNLLSFVQNSPVSHIDPFGFKSCTSFRYRHKHFNEELKFWKLEFKGSLETLVEGKACSICCSDGSRGEESTVSVSLRGNFVLSVPVTTMYGVTVSVFGSAQKGGAVTTKSDTCTGRRSLTGCKYTRISGGVEGCGGCRGIGEICVRGEGFLRWTHCYDGSSSGCEGVRVLVRACALWKCKEWVPYQYEDCRGEGPVLD